MDLTGSFIREHWHKLEMRPIQLVASLVDSVRTIDQFISSSTSPLPLPSSHSPPTTTSTISTVHDRGTSEETNSPVFGIKLLNITLDELNKFLGHMELSSLLIPSSPSSCSSPLSPTSRSRGHTPTTISLECMLQYGRGDSERWRVHELERDMYELFKSRTYCNVSSFIVRTDFSH
jgi:hypothetical protein